MLNSVNPRNGIQVLCLLKHLWSQCQPTECSQGFSLLKVNRSAFKINTESCLRSSIINRRKARAENLQTIPFVALSLPSVQLFLCPVWSELLKADAVPSQMSGECLAHGESFHK